MTEEVTTKPEWRPRADQSIYQRSTIHSNGTTYFLVRSGDDDSKVLAVHGDTSGFEGVHLGAGEPLLCPLTPAHAAVLRGRLSWLSPVTLGLQTSAGFGDRLGLATPGHVRAIRRDISAGLRENHGVKPISTDGDVESRWVVLDYGDVVVHVFHADRREFYSLEDLWSDAPRVMA